MVCQTTSFNAK